MNDRFAEVHRQIRLTLFLFLCIYVPLFVPLFFLIRDYARISSLLIIVFSLAF